MAREQRKTGTQENDFDFDQYLEDKADEEVSIGSTLKKEKMKAALPEIFF